MEAVAVAAEVAADVVVAAAPPVLLDVLHIVSAHFAVEGNIAVGICQETWRDKRIWMAIIDMMHKPKKVKGRKSIAAPRLVIASKKGRLDVVQRLLDLDANIEAKSTNGSTALTWACKYGHKDVASCLLDRHANIDALNNNNKSALWTACYFANVKATHLLLARGANIDLGDPPILDACQDVHEGDQADTDMSTLWARRSKVVRLLADHHANLNVVDADGDTALMLASRCNQAAIIERLLDKHVDIDALNNNNKSALNVACYWANVEAARVLLTRGANVNLGVPPILEACRNVPERNRAQVETSKLWARRLQVVRLLAYHKANLNVVDADGLTALMRASRYNQAAIIELLVKKHANIDALDNNNRSALNYACYWANINAAYELLDGDKRANLNLGEPPILAACVDIHEDDQAETDMSTLWDRRYEIVTALTRRWANLDVVDADGDGPLDLAEINEQWDIVDLLRTALGEDQDEDEDEEEEEEVDEDEVHYGNYF